MDKIGQLIQRGFQGGVVFGAVLAGAALILYLFSWLLGALGPKEVKWEERELRSHRFYQVSGRARVAYLILCLEEALVFYGQDLSAWEWLLRKLWTITSDPGENGTYTWMDTWLDAVGELLPSEVLTDRGDTSLSEEGRRARELYTGSGTAMVVLNAILDSAYTIVGQWDYTTESYDLDGLRRIREAEGIMRSFGVPLPTDERVRPLLEQRDPMYGEPFDGFRCSRLYKGG